MKIIVYVCILLTIYYVTVLLTLTTKQKLTFSHN